MKSVAVRKIGKKGKGVFALRDFKEGEYIMRINGKIMSASATFELPYHYVNHMCTVGEDKWVVMGIPERYINHSCNPNIYDKKRKVYAMRDIKSGEELTFDYTMNGVDGEDWKLKCQCGSKNCRKKVTGEFFALSRKMQIKYLPYIEDWFRKKYGDRIEKLKN